MLSCPGKGSLSHIRSTRCCFRINSVFNDTNYWLNIQHENRRRDKLDLDDPNLWLPLMQSTNTLKRNVGQEEKDVGQDQTSETAKKTGPLGLVAYDFISNCVSFL